MEFIRIIFIFSSLISLSLLNWFDQVSILQIIKAFLKKSLSLLKSNCFSNYYKVFLTFWTTDYQVKTLLIQKLRLVKFDYSALNKTNNKI